MINLYVIFRHAGTILGPLVLRRVPGPSRRTTVSRKGGDHPGPYVDANVNVRPDFTPHPKA